MWMKFDDPATLKAKYRVLAVHYTDEIEKNLKELAPEKIYILDGINSDSDQPPLNPAFPFLDHYLIDRTTIYYILAETRVVKSEEELQLLRFVNQLSSQAHIRVMQNIKPNKGLKEYQSEALFRFHCHERGGARHLSYPCICASSDDAATLHYIINEKELKDGALFLNDMGARYHGYCADITCTYPINGKFTKHQAEIYNAVLKAQRQVIKTVKPGIKWDDMHLLAERIIVTDLIQLGLIKNTPIEELVEERIGAIFFPHGLGHFVGLQVHDVGGYNPDCPERIMKLGLKSLRTRRTLKEGMVITVEPGCYFIHFAIENALKDDNKAKYLNADKINEYCKQVSGIRIEDVITITKDGCELLSDVPRQVEEIEKCMAGQDWRKTK